LLLVVPLSKIEHAHVHFLKAREMLLYLYILIFFVQVASLRYRAKNPKLVKFLVYGKSNDFSEISETPMKHIFIWMDKLAAKITASGAPNHPRR